MIALRKTTKDPLFHTVLFHTEARLRLVDKFDGAPRLTMAQNPL